MPRNLPSASRRNLARLGELVTVKNYKFDRTTTDEYGDDDRVERADSPYENVPASVRTMQGRVVQNTGRRGSDTDIVLLLPSTHAAVTNLAGGPDNAPSSRITRSSGETLGVLMHIDQGNGLIEATCEVIST